MGPYEKFRLECEEEARAQGADPQFLATTREWFDQSMHMKYSYHFEWMGRPIIQFPQDIVAMQELIFRVKPDLVIEAGIAHGGSLILYSSLLELNTMLGGPSDAAVIGIDIEIRPHNRIAIQAHPMSGRITMLEGSSTDPSIVEEVRRLADGRERVMVCLDSLHGHDHVLGELEAYAPLTSIGSYCVVFDTVAEWLPESYFGVSDRRCGPGNSPMTAVQAYLVNHPEFEADHSITDKLMITVSPGGYLQRVS